MGRRNVMYPPQLVVLDFSILGGPIWSLTTVPEDIRNCTRFPQTAGRFMAPSTKCLGNGLRHAGKPLAFKSKSNALVLLTQRERERRQEISRFVFHESAEEEEDMKTMIWSAETASNAYIETIQILNPSGLRYSSDVAELVSAMAAGSDAQLIVEAWAAPGAGVATSVGLAVARRHTGGRHVCVVPDERSRLEYVDATSEAGISPEVVVGEAEDAMQALAGVDFVVVDGRRRDAGRLLRFAKTSSRGAVLVRTHAGSEFRWRGLLGSGTRVLRSTFLPVGEGLEITQLGKGGSESVSVRGRWISHVDRTTGEENGLFALTRKFLAPEPFDLCLS
ncbi:hypothetical protein ACLOJK_033461 [Asimina triloba]